MPKSLREFKEYGELLAPITLPTEFTAMRMEEYEKS
jgi:hypothetical protein